MEKESSPDCSPRLQSGKPAPPELTSPEPSPGKPSPGKPSPGKPSPGKPSPGDSLPPLDAQGARPGGLGDSMRQLASAMQRVEASVEELEGRVRLTLRAALHENLRDVLQAMERRLEAQLEEAVSATEERLNKSMLLYLDERDAQRRQELEESEQDGSFRPADFAASSAAPASVAASAAEAVSAPKGTGVSALSFALASAPAPAPGECSSQSVVHSSPPSTTSIPPLRSAPPPPLESLPPLDVPSPLNGTRPRQQSRKRIDFDVLPGNNNNPDTRPAPSAPYSSAGSDPSPGSDPALISSDPVGSGDQGIVLAPDAASETLESRSSSSKAANAPSPSDEELGRWEPVATYLRPTSSPMQNPKPRRTRKSSPRRRNVRPPQVSRSPWIPTSNAASRSPNLSPNRNPRAEASSSEARNGRTSPDSVPEEREPSGNAAASLRPDSETGSPSSETLNAQSPQDSETGEQISSVPSLSPSPTLTLSSAPTPERSAGSADGGQLSATESSSWSSSVFSRASSSEREGDGAGHGLPLREACLIVAAKQGSLELVLQCLEARVNPDVQDSRGNTALHYATANGSVEVVKALLKYGAGTNIQNKMASTPLHAAAASDSTGECTAALLAAGACTDMVDVDFKTPLQIATASGNQASEELLRKAEADLARTCMGSWIRPSEGPEI